MATREGMIGLLNQSGLASSFAQLKAAIVNRAISGLVDLAEPATTPADREAQDRALLNSVGPAAASAAIDWAIKNCRGRGKLKDINFNCSYTNNYNLVANDSDFSDSLRAFLMPRSAFQSFDNMVDPRHQIDLECGYPRHITPVMYRYMYDRDDTACRVNDIYPDESWAVDPLVYEDEDEEVETPFEKAWNELCRDYDILQLLYRSDKLAGVGHYLSLLIGVEGEPDLEKPIEEPELLAGVKGSVGKKQRKPLYFRPFDEYLSFIQEYETDKTHPRYGQPKYYNLVFLDMTVDSSGGAVGTKQSQRVHWTRIIHIAENILESTVFGKPRQQSCFNRLLDLRKIKGSSAEMFWKGGFPGISFEINPEFAADEAVFDEEALKEEIEKYATGMQRYLRTMGVVAKSLAPNISDPDKHVLIQMQAIAAHIGVPLRVFMGSEEGRLASTQDKLTWHQRLKRRLRTFVEPNIIRNFINRLIAIGMLPKPKQLIVEWSDLNVLTDEDKANLSLKWTQALSQYVSTGIIHMIRPMDYMTMILGLMPSQAKKISSVIEKEGGWAKLLKVDPSQGAGVNGKRENITDDDDNSERGGRKKRNSSDKQAEGMSS